MATSRRTFVKQAGAAGLLLVASDRIGELIAQSPQGEVMKSKFKGKGVASIGQLLDEARGRAGEGARDLAEEGRGRRRQADRAGGREADDRRRGAERDATQETLGWDELADRFAAASQELRQKTFRHGIERHVVLGPGETVSFVRVQHVLDFLVLVSHRFDNLVALGLLDTRIVRALPDQQWHTDPLRLK
mgnify:CR=1 FL=1